MHRVSFLLSIIVILIVCGCASGMVKKAPSGTRPSALGEDVLIFGCLKWIQNDKEKKKGSVFLRVLRCEDMEKGSITVEKDGRFYATLSKGTYLIHRIDWRDLWDGPHWVAPRVAFQIANDQDAYYLGTLVMEIATKRDIIGGLWIEGETVHVEDEEGAAMDAFRIRYSGQELKVAKTLMVHDPRIPRIIETERMLFDVLRYLQFGLMTSQ